MTPAERNVFGWIAVAALLLGCLAASCSRADELIFHGATYHFDQRAGYESANPGLGYIHDSHIAAGVYRNSIRRTSVYAGYLWRANEYFGVLGGVVTGYNRMAVQPAAVLVFTLPLDERWSLHLNAAPLKQGFLNLAVGYQLGK